jgi:acetyl esterase
MSEARGHSTSTTRTVASVEPSLVAFVKDLAARGLGTPEPAEVGIAEARRRNEAYFRAIATSAPHPSSAATVQVTGETGAAVPMRVVVPATALPGAPALLYLHGGGYAFGDLDTHDHIFRWLANAAGMTVFGLHYRRTPEAAYPAQIHDSIAAIAAIRTDGMARRFGYDPHRVLLFGDSAGAHLCMGLMLTLRARGLPQPVAASLAYGMYARRFDTWSHRTYGDGSYGLSTFRMRWFWDQLMAGHDARNQDGKVDPIAEPMHADLSGLPMLALYGAECDCLLDETLDFRTKLKDAGAPHTFHMFERMIHAFLHFPSAYHGSRDAFTRIGLDLRAMEG